MAITVDSRLYTALDKLKHIDDDVKETVQLATNVAAFTMNQVIETDNNANASVPTGKTTKWDPLDPGRRTQPNISKTHDLQEELKVIPTQTGSFIGWENPVDYMVAQDLGWGSGGEASRPAGALYENVQGAHFVEAGYNAAKDVIETELNKITNQGA
jgi:hypothetical protein